MQTPSVPDSRSLVTWLLLSIISADLSYPQPHALASISISLNIPNSFFSLCLRPWLFSLAGWLLTRPSRLRVSICASTSSRIVREALPKVCACTTVILTAVLQFVYLDLHIFRTMEICCIHTMYNCPGYGEDPKNVCRMTHLHICPNHHGFYWIRIAKILRILALCHLHNLPWEARVLTTDHAVSNNSELLDTFWLWSISFFVCFCFLFFLGLRCAKGRHWGVARGLVHMTRPSRSVNWHLREEKNKLLLSLWQEAVV